MTKEIDKVKTQATKDKKTDLMVQGVRFIKEHVEGIVAVYDLYLKIIEAKVKVTSSEQQHVVNLLKLLIKEDINIKNISYKRNKLNNIVATYLKENAVNNTEKVINGVLKKLQKEK